MGREAWEYWMKCGKKVLVECWVSFLLSFICFETIVKVQCSRNVMGINGKVLVGVWDWESFYG